MREERNAAKRHCTRVYYPAWLGFPASQRDRSPSWRPEPVWQELLVVWWVRAPEARNAASTRWMKNRMFVIPRSPEGCYAGGA